MEISRERWDELALLVTVFVAAIVLTHILTYGIPDLSVSSQAFATAGAINPSRP